MPSRDADRNLLFGINALQNDFITRDALIAAMNAWALEKHRSLGDILVERNALKPEDRDLLTQLIDRHLARHGGDPAASLAAMSSVGSVADDLRKNVADPDVLGSIANIPTGSQPDPYATRATLPPDSPSAAVRFRKLREHASGNLGVVYIARDEELNREVALKEIKEKNADHLHSQAKFRLEAEVTGGLEHPGIVPVYGLGHYDDGRPFYAMRFIRGKSLLDAIRRFHADDTLKSDPGQRHLALQKLLRRFTDVCNAVAYAHSRGVLHRDLKPDNVMVGKYGETLVVDWGLAKALGQSGETIEDPEDPLPEASLQPASADGLEETKAGSRVGTPAYMSPEQAAGRLDLLGPASDIYGLGATLYHLLVGRPPIEATSLGDLYAKIEAGEITRPRIIAPWLDPALEAICLKAMALKPESRYDTPRVLAEDLDRWIAGEPVAAYPEPWSRRTRRWAKKHRTALTTASSAAIVTALLLCGVAWVRISQGERVDASARVAMGRADASAIRARATGELTEWEKAIAEAMQAEARLDSGGGSAALRREVTTRLESFRAEQARRREALDAEEKDRRVVDALDEARLRSVNEKDGHFDYDAKHEAFLVAFRTYGIDVGTLPIEDVARRIRSSRVEDHLISALDDWMVHKSSNISRERLAAIARATETDPGRAAIRDAVARRDAAGLRRLCEREEDRRKLGPKLRSVFYALGRLDPAGSFSLLEAIRRENPSDFWLNHDLGTAYLDAKPPQIPEALRCLSVAVSLRPDSLGARLNIGQALRVKGDLDGAIAELRLAAIMKTESAEVHNDLGWTLATKGDLDGAIGEYRVAIRINPQPAIPHSNLGNALSAKGDLDGAVGEYRVAIRINPEDAMAHFNLGLALFDKGDLDGAVGEYRVAIRINPEDAGAHVNLGNTLISKGDLDGAIAEHRTAIRIDPDLAESHCNLGLILQSRGLLSEALGYLERGHELGSKRPDWRFPSAQYVSECQLLVEVEGRLPAILKGQGSPKDTDERLILADLCAKKKLNAGSGRFFGEAFAEKPALADDLDKGYRYNAACSASLAGSGLGKDEPMPDEAGRAKLREQAVGWLRADLAAWVKILDGGNEAARKQAVAKTLAHWKVDADLAGIRDEAALGKLPEGEREAFRSLWADVEALRKKAEADVAVPPKE